MSHIDYRWGPLQNRSAKLERKARMLLKATTECDYDESMRLLTEITDNLNCCYQEIGFMDGFLSACEHYKREEQTK